MRIRRKIILLATVVMLTTIASVYFYITHDIGNYHFASMQYGGRDLESCTRKAGTVVFFATAREQGMPEEEVLSHFSRMLDGWDRERFLLSPFVKKAVKQVYGPLKHSTPEEIREKTFKTCMSF